jgi:hypothetical protein
MSAKAGTKFVVEQEDAAGAITYEEIAVRAYEIHVSGGGGDEVGNWLRAETELIAELASERELDDAAEVEQDAHIAA